MPTGISITSWTSSACVGCHYRNHRLRAQGTVCFGHAGHHFCQACLTPASWISRTISRRNGPLRLASGSVTPIASSRPAAFILRSSTQASARRRDILLVDYDEHMFIAPDNGLLGLLLDNADSADVYNWTPVVLQILISTIPTPRFTRATYLRRSPPSWQLAEFTPANIGRKSADWTPAWLDRPDVQDGKVTGVVISFDSFGNLITDIRR